MANIQDVARAAGVSVTTVSLVLNNKGNISPETRAHVLKVVADMGYTRSVHARNLRDNQSRVIGYPWDRRRSDFNPVLDNFLYEVMRLNESSGRHLLMFMAEQNNTLQTYTDLIDSKRVDGFILSHTDREDERVAYLYENHVPFVAFGRTLSKYDELTHWVDVDGTWGIFSAVEHLLQQGHQHIGFIGWPQGSAAGDARFAGYTSALESQGVKVDEALVMRTVNETPNGYEAAMRLLKRNKALTAIVAVSDNLAVGALRYISENNVRIAITGFDNTPLADFTVPPLTSVHQPVKEAAALSITMLNAQLIGKPVEVKHHLLKPKLIIRDSSLLSR